MRRFFLRTAETALPQPGDSVLLDQDESHHLLGVRRRGSDESLGLVDGRGRLYAAELVGRQGKRAKLTVLAVAEDPTECAPPRLRLACGVIKGRRWDQVLEKAVELGVHAICPLTTAHAVVTPRENRGERWQAVLRAALKQSGRLWLPTVAEPATLRGFLAGDAGGPVWWGAVPHERSAAQAIATAQPSAADWFTLVVGPEGGWSAEEREDLGSAGALPLDLGPHVLRTETAAAAGLTLLQQWRCRCLPRP